ncbi:MAG: phosphomannomutase [Phototrophicales bacterium]|nr:MAG: phosphomannomutase [Phototrophicales bacterium]
MTTIPSNIFRKYDIRGVVEGPEAELTPYVAEHVGKAYGTYVQREFDIETIYVGGDNRLSTPPLKDALIRGLLSTGVRVIDIGEVLTPTVYFAAASHEKSGGVMITGSHLTTKYNGIKMAYGKLALADDQIQALLKLIQTDDFDTGDGKLSKDYQMIHKHMQTIKSKVKMGPRKLKVVVDAGNGLSGTYVPAVMAELGVEVVCLYCESDGRFPNHLPNPEDPELTKDLEAKVLEVGADLGIGFDGDADRCGVIDNHGHHVSADRLIAILARDLLKRHPGATVVYDVKASQLLDDIILESGGRPLMWKSGHSLMKAKIHEVGALLGGEVSGHIFIGEDYYGFDDAPLVALKTLEILSNTDQPISEIIASMPSMLATPEIILPAPDDVKFEIINKVKQVLESKYKVIDVDGARVQFEHGWGLVRASNTQPAITLRFEAHTRQQMVEYMNIFDQLLQDFPQVDRERLLAQIAAFS